jgi:1-acyl-sn-glycerol-3-phosphate acyltransferase
MTSGKISDVVLAAGELSAAISKLALSSNPALASIIEQGNKDIFEQLALVIGDRFDNQAEFFAERMSGNYAVDEFGFDPALTEEIFLPILRTLFEKWFRGEVKGSENIPTSGAALLVSNHSGTLPLDSLMTQVSVFDHTQRHMRSLGADLIFSQPWLSELARKSGVTLACQEDADRLLRNGELVGVWPEGFKGIGKPYRDRYKLQRFGRGGFVASAIKSQVPIIPVSIVGAEETYPMIYNATLLARLLGVPYFPITPTFPWLGLFGMVPLPSKWIIEFGTPIETVGYDDDPIHQLELSEIVRAEIQTTIDRLLADRGEAFL